MLIMPLRDFYEYLILATLYRAETVNIVSEGKHAMQFKEFTKNIQCMRKQEYYSATIKGERAVIFSTGQNSATTYSIA